MDAFTEIGVFTRVVEVRSFTRAGKQLGLTASGVSRVVSRLEERLGVRLLNRTTRSISLTDDGSIYYERCAKILAELEDANLAMARSRRGPRGRLRVDAPHVLGEFVLGPALPRFLNTYPDVSLDLSLRDHFIDPVAEGIDVLVRMAELRESDLVSKRLGSARLVVAGAPSYFSKHGRPKTIADLHRHRCIGYLSDGSALPWRLRNEAGEISFAVNGSLRTNNGPTLRKAAVEGVGLICVFEYHVAADIRAGRLERVLREYEPAPRPIYALYARHKHAAPKVRAFLDFLSEVFSAGQRGRRYTGSHGDRSEDATR